MRTISDLADHLEAEADDVRSGCWSVKTADLMLEAVKALREAEALIAELEAAIGEHKVRCESAYTDTPGYVHAVDEDLWKMVGG